MVTLFACDCQCFDCSNCARTVQELKVGERAFPVVSNPEEEVVEMMELTAPGAALPLATHKGSVVYKAHVQVRSLPVQGLPAPYPTDAWRSPSAADCFVCQILDGSCREGAVKGHLWATLNWESGNDITFMVGLPPATKCAARYVRSGLISIKVSGESAHFVGWLVGSGKDR